LKEWITTASPKHALNYKPRGRRERGRPRKRWQCVDAGTGQTTMEEDDDDDDDDDDDVKARFTDVHLLVHYISVNMS